MALTGCELSLSTYVHTMPVTKCCSNGLLPHSNVIQATGVTCAYASRTLMGSWLLVCVGMGAQHCQNSCPFLTDAQGGNEDNT
jgi:hypothetical protein